MKLRLILAGAVAGIVVAACVYLFYPRFHALLPAPLAMQISSAVQALRQPPEPTDGGPGKRPPWVATRQSGAEAPPPRRPGQPAPYSGQLPSLAAINIRDAQLDLVHGELARPWSMEFIDERSILIAEQAGRLQLLDLASGATTPIEGLPAIESGRGQLGLMDIALHPNFHANRRLYFTYSVTDDAGSGFATALGTGVLGESAISAVNTLLVATPHAKSMSNFGGAIEFDDQGFLYVAMGDKSERNDSQDKRSLKGKILRLRDDGTAPADNPFAAAQAARPEIYALGVRNPQGLVFDRRRRVLFEAEHGPMGGDEVNAIRAGANYGWPVVSYGAFYNTKKVGIGTQASGFAQPLYYYLPSIAVSPIAVYYGEMFPEWDGHLLVGALKGQHVSKLDITDDGVRSDQRILQEARGRVRDIKVAVDGSIYLLIQEPVGGRLLRLWRNPALLERTTPGMRSAAAVYDMFCASCHDVGASGAPRSGDSAEWARRAARGPEALYQSTLVGYGDMPARGLCGDCTDEELRLAVDYLLQGPADP